MIRLYRMDCLIAIKLLAVLTFVHATNGQTVTVSGPSRVAADDDTSLTCTVNGGTASLIQWFDDSESPSVNIYSGPNRFSTDDKYLNFKVPVLSLSDTQSVMTIENAEVEDDDGEYRCVIPTDPEGNAIDLVIEAESTKTLTLTSMVTNNVDMYVATCYAAGGKPPETITWTLNGVTQTDGIENSNPTATPPTSPLSNTMSVFTFPATQENYNQTLVCQVSGHDVLTDLNGEVPKNLTIHESAAGFTVTVDYATQDTGITVSCSAETQPTPAMRNYYIFSNGALINESMEGVKTFPVSDPIEGTNYTCMAGNYLGNTPLSAAVPYDPSRTTTPPPTTETTEGITTAPPGPPATQPSTTDNIVTDPTGGPNINGLGPGAYAGIAIGVIACIVIIVVIVLYFLKPECCPCFAGSGSSSGSSNKPTGRAVGSSNGSEKDVESPLNGVKDVTAEEKTRPEAAPRGHGSIQHTNDNPNQDMYAMVDKKKPAGGGGGGDVPDRGSGPGQNEPGSMLYADLDLSHKAGHTDKHVPKNENDVVVYSSILV